MPDTEKVEKKEAIKQEKKKHVIHFAIKAEPTSYSVKGICLSELIDKEFKQLLESENGYEFVAMVMMYPKAKVPLMLEHKNHDDYENGILEVASPDSTTLQRFVSLLERRVHGKPGSEGK